MPETKAIYKKLQAVFGDMVSVPKTGTNTAQGYAYSKFEDYHDILKPLLDRHGVVAMMSIADILPQADGATKSGGVSHHVYVKGNLIVTDAASGESLSIGAVGEGVDSGDKAIYKAITGMRKYAFAQAFNMVTTDDPENDEHDVKADAKEAARHETKGGQPRASKPQDDGLEL